MTEPLLTAIATDDSQGATEQELDDAAAALGIELPEDYRPVMRHANGGEIEFGESWIVIDPLEAVLDRNTILREGRFPTGFTFSAATAATMASRGIRGRSASLCTWRSPSSFPTPI